VPNTPRCSIPFPSENQDPFYDQFVGMVEAVDSALYAEREDRQLVLAGGGSFSAVYDAPTLKLRLSWDANIRILAPITGFYWYIAPGFVDLLDGQALYVSVARAPTQNVAVLAQVGSQVPSTDANLLIAARIGGNVYFRNGRAMKDGEVFAVLDASSTSAGAAEYKAPCRVATQASTDLADPPAVVDGITLAVGDRILVWQQALPAQNGIYSLQSIGTPNVWNRALDFNDTSPVKGGSLVVVTEGTNADNLLELATNNPIVIGVTAINFVVMGSNLATVAPAAVQAADTGIPGVSGKAAREDHRHAVSTGLLASIQPVSSAIAAAGTAATLARSDHRHNLQVDFAQGGTVIGSRPILNFISGVTLADVPGSNWVTASVNSFGTSGQVIRSNIPIVLGQNTNQGTAQIVGQYVFAASDYALTGTTVSTKFKACVYLTGGATGEVQLWDLTAGAAVASGQITFVSAAPTQLQNTVSLNSAPHTYEIRIWISAGTGSIFCQWAGIEVLNTIN
jgi:hypothetical protein